MCITIQLAKGHSPVHQDATTGVEAVLNETVGHGEVLKQVLVVDIVNLDDMVGERTEQFLVERQA